MSKSKEELNELKKEVEAVNEKLSELTDEELAQVTGGGGRPKFIAGFLESAIPASAPIVFEHKTSI